MHVSSTDSVGAVMLYFGMHDGRQVRSYPGGCEAKYIAEMTVSHVGLQFVPV